MADDRSYDLVLYGATGFAGGLTAEYIAAHAPEDCRWALAGRDLDRLAQVRERLTRIDSALADLPLLAADSTDRPSMTELARSTRVVISTVGPYLTYGEPLVAACAQAGTDYVDLTGEAEFIDEMFLQHHQTARASGARLVHACGFDSIPHDLGAYFTVRELQPHGAVRMRGVVRTNARFSGGTFHSALTAISRPRQMMDAAKRRRQREERPGERRVRTARGNPHRDRDLGYWLVPLPTVDPFIVARSAMVLPEYGADFTYSHYAGTKTLPYAIGGLVGAGVLGVAAQVGPIRDAMLRRINPGEGPSAHRRERSWFTVDFIAEAGERQIHTRVSGGDPGYAETAKMLAESAFSLAFDDNPQTSGQVTTAVAMGENLLRRLIEAGMEFEVVERRP